MIGAIYLSIENRATNELMCLNFFHLHRKQIFYLIFFIALCIFFHFLHDILLALKQIICQTDLYLICLQKRTSKTYVFEDKMTKY